MLIITAGRLWCYNMKSYHPKYPPVTTPVTSSWVPYKTNFLRKVLHWYSAPSPYISTALQNTHRETCIRDKCYFSASHNEFKIWIKSYVAWFDAITAVVVKKNTFWDITSFRGMLCLSPTFTLSCTAYFSTLKMEAISSSETSVDFQQTMYTQYSSKAYVDLKSLIAQI
jgi:hypothetical protein